MAQTNLIGKEILGYTVSEKIGSGAFGTVYKAVKTNFSGQYIRALKHITIPTEKQYNSVLNSMGGNVSKANNYFSQMLNNIVSEIRILNNLSEQGVQHIVRYYENDIHVTKFPTRYDIFILMENLTPLDEYIQKTDFCVRDVIRVGLDILNGLKSCHDSGVIHRDIKDDNIFVSDKGEYKIGDFGVSKMLKDSPKAESLKGTPNFLAPEVFFGKESYTKSVDLYSLGIVLYRLLNYSRNPFLPVFPEQYYEQDETSAFEKRMKGMIPPYPILGGEKIGRVIVKSISGKNERFQTADEFITALEEAVDNTPRELFNIQIKSETFNMISKKQERKFRETLGEMPNSFDEKNGSIDERSNLANKYLFESFGTTPSINDSKEDSDVEKNNVDKKISKINRSRTDKKASHFVPFEIEKLEKISVLDKNMVNKSIFVIPAVILIIGLAAYFIVIPGIYGQVVSFIDWLFTDSSNIIGTLRNPSAVLSQVNSIIAAKIFWWIWLASLICSLFFVGKKIQNKTEPIADSIFLKKNNPYLMIKKIYNSLNKLKMEDSVNNNKELNFLIYKIKKLEEKISVENNFGYGDRSVINCEINIVKQLQFILKQISQMEKDITLEEKIKDIHVAVINIDDLLQERTILKKK